MEDTNKLTRSQRQTIIFNHLKGIEDPSYQVIETKHGRYIVKPKVIELEEEETINEPPPIKEEETINEVQQVKPKDFKRKRAKQDAKRILDALTSIINDSSDEEPENDYQRAPPIIEPNNFNPSKLSFHRRRLAF